ncbi:MAG: 30S ribosomal protein S21 [Patescibacteria group bacterium]
MSAIEVKRNNNETSSSVLRRFSRRVSGAGALKRVRNSQYAERAKSDLKQKKEALKRLTRRAEYEHLRKLGKIKDVFTRK